MSTETAVPPVAPAAPVIPAAPAKPVTPPVPAAQAASAPKTEVPTKKEPAKTASELSFQANLKKISADLEAKQAAGDKVIENPKAETPAAPVTPEKPSEVPVKPSTEQDRFSDVLEPDGATDTTKKGWKALKEKANTEIAAAEKKLADAQAQIETYRKATPAEQADVAKLKSDLQAAHDRLAVLDVTAHPEFTKQYIEPKKKALTEAATLLSDNAVTNAPEMATLLSLNRQDFQKKVSELAAGLPTFDQVIFVQNMREAYRLEGDQKGAISKAGELQQQLQAKTAQRQKQAFEETFNDFGTKLKPLEMPTDAAPEVRSEIEAYNNALASIRPSAETYAFGQIDDKGVGSLAAKAASLDFLVKTAIPRQQREFARREAASEALIKDLTAKLEGVRAAKNPGAFTASQEPTRSTGPKTFADVAREVGMKNP